DFPAYQWYEDRDLIIEGIALELGFPVFVKPIHLGSTVGVRRVEKEEDLEGAVEYALGYDTHLIVESAIEGCRELEFAVFGNDEIHVFPSGEILTDGKVYDYHSKYAKDGMKTDPCAKVPQNVIDEGMILAGLAYRAVGCCGLARVDFFLDR